MTEREQWKQVAEDLGYRVEECNGNLAITGEETGVHMLMFGDEAKDRHTLESVAMLHGLACLRVNGYVVRRRDGVWLWSHEDTNPEADLSEPFEANYGDASTHPAALLSMLAAHREASDE